MPGTLLAIGWTALLLYLMRRMPFFAHLPGLRMRWVAAAFVLKILAGTALWAVYTYVHTDRATADVHKYFDDSRVLHEALLASPGDYLRMLFGIDADGPRFTEQYYSRMNNWVRRWDSGLPNDARTMIRFNAVLRLASFGHYHVHTVFASFVSLIGLVALYRAFEPHAGGLRRGLALNLLLWPSVLFWGSGVLKECLLLAGLGLTCWGVMGRWQPGGWQRWCALAAGVVLMLAVKLYVFACLVPPLAAWAWCAAAPGRAWAKFLAVHAAFMAAAFAIGAAWPAYDPLYLLALKQHDFIGLAATVPTGSYLPVEKLLPTAASFIQQLPRALFTAFLSPFAVLANGPLAWAGAAESALLIAVPITGIALRRGRKALDLPALLLALHAVLLLALVIGYTVPIVGSLVRYRVPMLPFAGLIALLLIDPARLPARLRHILQG